MGQILSTMKSKRVITNFVLGLLVMQPILDIISFFCVDSSLNIVTTLFRMAIFGVVVLYAFIIAENKRVYFITAGILGIFWIFHMIACVNEGYISIYKDVAMYIRTIQMPVFTLAFITFFREVDALTEKIGKVFLFNYLIITASIILSYVVGRPEYTYNTGYGIKGWFYTGNAQSCIISVMAPLGLYYAYRKKNNLLFLFTIVIEFVNMYLFGTRVAYYSIFIVGIAFVIFLIWNKEKRIAMYCITIAMMMICGWGYKFSPCYLQQYAANQSYAESERKISSILKESETELGSALEEGVDPADVQIYDMEYYKEIYNMYCEKLVDRFGIERVVKKYDYSTAVGDLVSNRELKVNYGSLVMDEKNELTHLFGFEYMNYIYDGEVFDPENDFPAIYFSNGYIGLGLYIVFVLYFAFVALKSIIVDKGKISLEKGMLGTSIVLMLGAAQLSGNVLRRPNVSIFLSVMLAYLFVICVSEKKGKEIVS